MTLHKMNSDLFPSLVLHFIITIFCILIAIPSSYSNDDEQYLECRSHYSCGLVGNIEYPFLGDNRPSYCGREGFKLNCLENELPTLQSGFQGFQVISTDPSQQIILIARQDLWRGNSCSEIFQEITVNQTLFNLGAYVQNLSLFYNCTEEFSSEGSPNNFSCHEGNEERKGFYTVEGMEELGNLSNTCSRVNTVPVLFTPPNKVHLRTGHLREALSEGFNVGYRVADNESCSACVNSQGICGSNSSSSEQFVCLCRDGPHPLNCTSSKSGSDLNLRRLKIVIGSVAAGSGIIVICLIICHFRLKISSFISTAFLGKIITKNGQDIEAFIRNFGPLTPNRYSFSDVKKMTNSFNDKLGQGGYGGVYKGKLSDGQTVAVKLLNTSKENGQEFINEVASISRTSHVNVVTLLGFCLEGSKRALIYEFMPNGSLEKFIYKEDNLKASQCLGWDQMYEIAIGIARGLEYLHRGCNTRILHFDIKPHNILLDKDFCPKISDFGLAKLCLKKESIVSMLAARGTIGYIAPEVFFRNFGEVSHKSDVYSYGMMVLEMVGGRSNLDVGVDHTSEIYLPHWIYKHIEQDKELKWHDVSTNEENEIAKKMIIVGLWCIQTRPLDRPSMNRVIDMLQGSTKPLQIPPPPFLTTPPRPPIYSSTTSM